MMSGPREPSRRLHYIDSTRGIAAVLAVLAHLSTDQFRFVDHGLLGATSGFTRMATPMFMTLFGVMIALVYIPRLSRGPGEQDLVARRLMSRMVTCYLVYGAITLAAVLTGKIPPEKGLEAMVFANAGRFGEILKIYAVLFLVIVLTLPALKRYGFIWVLAMAGAGWLIGHVVAAIAEPGIYPLQFVTGYDRGFGPSVVHSLTFVAFGVAVGEAVSGRRSLLVPGILAGLSFAVLVAATWRLGPGTMAHGLGTYAFRTVNHPLYYAFGILATSGWLLVFALACSKGIMKAPAGALAKLGQRSLFVYGFGNVAMNLLPKYAGEPWIGLALSVAFMAVLILMSLDLSRDDSLLDRLSGGFLSGFRFRYEAMVQRTLVRVRNGRRGRRT